MLIAVHALMVQQSAISTTSNNIANVNTTAFKSGEASYADSFSNILQSSTPAPGTGAGSNTDSIEVGTGVSVSGVGTVSKVFCISSPESKRIASTALPGAAALARRICCSCFAA